MFLPGLTVPLLLLLHPLLLTSSHAPSLSSWRCNQIASRSATKIQVHSHTNNSKRGNWKGGGAGRVQYRLGAANKNVTEINIGRETFLAALTSNGGGGLGMGWNVSDIVRALLFTGVLCITIVWFHLWNKSKTGSRIKAVISIPTKLLNSNWHFLENYINIVQEGIWWCQRKQ